MGVTAFNRYRRRLAEQQAGVASAAPALPRPPIEGRGSGKGAWVEYAKSLGKSDDELDGLTRDEIAALFPEGDDDASTEQGEQHEGSEPVVQPGNESTATDDPDAVVDENHPADESAAGEDESDPESD